MVWGGLVVRGWWCGRASGEGLVVWGGEGLVVRGRDWWCERRANGWRWAMWGRCL